MKYKLPILTASLTLSLLACYWFLGPLDLQLLSLSDSGEGASDQASVTTGEVIGEQGSEREEPPHGQWLVGRAVQEIVGQESLQADVRQQVDLYGHHLVGVGRYRQFFFKGQQRLRLELKLQVAHQVSSLTQVADGRHLWIRQDMPDGTTLSRIDLRRVAEEVWQQSPGPPAQASMWMALGGLPKLLQGLEANFKFSPPQAAQWQQQAVWVTEGTWKPSLVKHHWGSQKSMPEYIPGRVQLVLGRDSEIPLFPYRIQFWRSAQAENEEGVKVKPMVTLEFHNVTRPSFFTLAMFDYKRGDQVVTNRTDTFLKSLRNPPWSFGEKLSP